MVAPLGASGFCAPGSRAGEGSGPGTSRRLAGPCGWHRRGRVAFIQGDACNLKPILEDYDLVFAANLLDRLHDPRKFLTSIRERLHVGGLLVVATPCTWLEEHTPHEAWLGGFQEDSRPFRTRDGLRRARAAHFEPVVEPVEVPFVIRETQRKHQHTLSEVTIWRRVR